MALPDWIPGAGALAAGREAVDRPAISAPSDAGPAFSVPGGGGPFFAVYDPDNHFVYVSDAQSDNVTVINGTKVVATLPVGGEPFFEVFDSRNGFVYVENFGSSNVTLLSNLTVLDSLSVGTDPAWGTYDSVSGLVDIPNALSDNVSLLQGDSVIGSLPVGLSPVSVTFDSENGSVFVSNWESQNVSFLCDWEDVQIECGSLNVSSEPGYGVFDSAYGLGYVPNYGSDSVDAISPNGSLAASMEVGADPLYLTVDSGSGAVYVSNVGSNDLTVIENVSVVGQVNVGSSPGIAAYDPANGFLYVPNVDSDNVTVLNGTQFVASVAVGASPEMAAWDAADGYLYVPNFLSENISVLGAPQFPVTVPSTGSGVPPGNSWSLAAGGQDVSVSTSTSASIALPNGTYPYLVRGPAGYQVVGVPPVGNLTVRGSSVTINGGAVSAISFVKAPTAGVIFSRTTLPAGAKWCVSVGGWGSCTAQPDAELLNLTPAVYPYRVWALTDYKESVKINGHAVPPAGFVKIKHGTVRISVKLVQIDYALTFSETGLVAGTEWTVKVKGAYNGHVRSSKRSSKATTIRFDAPDGTFSFVVSSTKKYGTAQSGSVTIYGVATTVRIEFTEKVATGVVATGAGVSYPNVQCAIRAARPLLSVT